MNMNMNMNMNLNMNMNMNINMNINMNMNMNMEWRKKMYLLRKCMKMFEMFSWIHILFLKNITFSILFILGYYEKLLYAVEYLFTIRTYIRGVSKHGRTLFFFQWGGAFSAPFA